MILISTVNFFLFKIRKLGNNALYGFKGIVRREHLYIAPIPRWIFSLLFPDSILPYQNPIKSQVAVFDLFPRSLKQKDSTFTCQRWPYRCCRNAQTRFLLQWKVMVGSRLDYPLQMLSKVAAGFPFGPPGFPP